MHPPPPRVRTVLKKKRKKRACPSRTDGQERRATRGLLERGTRAKRAAPRAQRFLQSMIAHLPTSGKQAREGLSRNAPAAAYIFPHPGRRQVSLHSCVRRQDASTRCTQGTSASAQLQIRERAMSRAFFDAGFTGVYAGQPGPSVEAAG